MIMQQNLISLKVLHVNLTDLRNDSYAVQYIGLEKKLINC